MKFSIKTVRLRSVCYVWAALAIIHFGLYTRFPELALVYAGHRDLWARWFVFLEGCCVFLAGYKGLSAINQAILDKSFKEIDRLGLVLFAILAGSLIFLYH